MGMHSRNNSKNLCPGRHQNLCPGRLGKSATSDTDTYRQTEEVTFPNEMPPRPSVLIMEPTSQQGLEAWHRIHHPQAATYTMGSSPFKADDHLRRCLLARSVFAWPLTSITARRRTSRSARRKASPASSSPVTE